MKKVNLLFIIILCASFTYSQQWSPITNGNIWNLNSGNVGIGTTSPSNKLDIASTNGQGLRIGKIGDPGNLNTAIGALSSQYNIDFTGYRDIQLDQIGARISALRYNNHQNNSAYVQKTGLAFYTNPSGINAGTTDLIERMRITPEGNVGIGTANPQAGLEIDKGNTNNFALILNSSGEGWGSGILFKNTAGTNYGIYSSNDKNLHFANDVTKQDFMVVYPTGDVLIVPNGKVLRANGTVIATKVMVRSNVWADYVFNENYKLKSLGEIDAYIKENKRLPDVPSTKEVIENGIDVAQMNVILLKKVEELTLLLIEQNNKIGSLERKMNELQK